ncbi:STAS domain-containing protein [Actinomadura opuntiae]|uniref:STAS domain-containing protein n=1 Tax=Actinomadura sp. OS1-43 TaxID=604315 RepID=UPI00255A9B33|nr:STAS domain-containing protein [Actinomadura sp. OS1-43]MDL4813741.1 STAS domain-containing protein [Actinomadura sp. OS1-43]
MTTAAPADDGSTPVPSEVRMPAHRRPGHTIIALRGGLDAAAAPALREHLLDVLRHSGRLLILDMGEVSSCDEVGLAVLVGIQHRAAAVGITVQLSAANRQFTDLLHATGLDRVFTVRTAPPAQAESAA